MDAGVRRCGRIGVAVALAAVAPSAWSQQEAAPARVEKIERIEVTGSSIPRIEGEGALPIQVISREALERGGVVTAQDLVDRISAAQSYGGVTESSGVGSAVKGATLISLRGLGSQRTLVLVNGRRLAPYALSDGSSADASGIPAAAIERVEVLLDGASAIYGTDAIGGVVNFILRKDFRGLELNGTYLGTNHGGGDSWRVGAAAGWGSLAADGLNVLVTVDHMRQELLRAAERSFSRTAYLPDSGVDFTSTQSWPANILQPGGFRGIFNPTIPLAGATQSSCAPPYSFPTRAMPLRCRFDYAALIDSVPEAQKTNVFGRLAWQIAPEQQLFAEGSYYRGLFADNTAPTPVSSFFTATPMTLPPGSPHYPADFVRSLPGGNPDLPLHVLYRLVELGPRVFETDAEQWRGVAGLKGEVRGWNYELAGSYVGNRQVTKYASGFVSERLFGPLLRSGVVNPFGLNTPEVLQRLQATQASGDASDNRASHYGGDLKVNGTPWELAGGPVAVALGIQGRRENLDLRISEYLNTGDIVGGVVVGALPTVEPLSRTVWSMLGEVNVPLAQSLEANVAVRHDRYGDFGGTTNPKVTLRWQPVKTMVLRGSLGTGFRAPTLYDVWYPTSLSRQGITGYPDPVRCPVTGADSDCADASYGNLWGGNRQLQPESSRQMSAGIVLEPMRELSANLDYYRVRLEDVIAVVPVDTIFNDYPRWGAALVVRNPPEAQHPGLAGPIDYVIQTPVNAGSTLTSGIDVGLTWRIPSRDYGRFTVSLTGTYLLTFESNMAEANVPGSVDRVSGFGALSRWRHYATIDWSRGPWGATLAQTFQNGYNEWDLAKCTAAGCQDRRVGSTSIVDVQASYTGIRDIVLRLGIRNVMDRAPPWSLFGFFPQVGFSPYAADPRGRMFYGSLNYSFK